MGFNSAIQWTDSTHNFWNGCRKVSAGCKFCYMHRLFDERKVNPNVVRRSDDKVFYRPLEWKEGRMIFTCSMSDFFIEEADPWRNEAWKVIKATPQHRWLILTKRPERIMDCLPTDWGEGYKNVALGVTIENQETVSRMHTLAEIPARVRFISAEPLLERVDLTELSPNGVRSIERMHQVIIGGESGNEIGKYRYRITEISWIQRMIRDVKKYSKAGVFVKQLGTYQANTWGLKHRHGGDLNEFPKSLRIREPITRPSLLVS